MGKGFMATRVSSHVQPIGVDLSGDCLRMAQAEAHEAGCRLLGSTVRSVNLSDEDAVRSALAESLRQGGFEGQRMATALPSGSVTVHQLRLESASPDRLQEAIRAEVAERLDYDVEQAEIRHIEVPSVVARPNQQELIVFSARRETVMQHLRLAEKLGMSVSSITAVPLAMGYAFSYLGRRREERDFTFLLVHLEQHLTHVVALQSGELRFARTMPLGVYDILAAAAKATGADLSALKSDLRDRMQRRQESEMLGSRMSAAPQAPSQADLPYAGAGAALAGFVEQIQSCTYYVSSNITGREVNKMVFSGPLANDYAFCQLLANRIGLPAQIGDPFAGVHTVSAEAGAEAAAATAGAGSSGSVAGDMRLPEPEMSVALGLSLYGLAMK